MASIIVNEGKMGSKKGHGKGREGNTTDRGVYGDEVQRPNTAPVIQKEELGESRIGRLKER